MLKTWTSDLKCGFDLRGKRQWNSAVSERQPDPAAVGKQDHAEQYSLWQAEEQDAKNSIYLTLDSFLHRLLSIQTNLRAMTFS